jgi:hypothetical protein
VIVGLSFGVNIIIVQLYLNDSRGYTSLHSTIYLIIENSHVVLD